MATSKEYKDYITGLLEPVGGITARPMMGEYLVYKDGLYFGGIFDNRFLVKVTPNGEKFNMETQIPYDGAKPMYMPRDIENTALLKEIVLATCAGLGEKAKNAKKVRTFKKAKEKK